MTGSSARGATGPVPLSARNSRVLRLRRLVRQAAVRREEGAFVVEGPKLLEAALDAGSAIDAVFVADGGGHPVVERVVSAGIPVYAIAPAVLERVADAVTPQPVLGVVRWDDVGLERLRPGGGAAGGGPLLVVVCVGLQDPGNLGAVLRSAEAAGASGIICCKGTVDLHNPKSVRASAGALFRVPVVSAGEPGEVLETLGRWGVRRLGTQAAAGVPPDACDLRGPTAFVLGNEGHGLPSALDDRLDDRITIPMAGAVESLNVSVAAAVLCFEAARQRRTHGVAQVG